MLWTHTTRYALQKVSQYITGCNAGMQATTKLNDVVSDYVI